MQSNILNLTDLRRRLQNGTRLREDHLWVLAKQAFPQLCSTHNTSGKRFEALLQANALLDALLLAVSALRPSVCLKTMRRTGDGWMCSASFANDAASWKAVGRHADLEGAVFIALLAILKRLRRIEMKTIINTVKEV
jgi:hypothetical protein